MFSGYRDIQDTFPSRPDNYTVGSDLWLTKTFLGSLNKAVCAIQVVANHNAMLRESLISLLLGNGLRLRSGGRLG